MPVYIFNTFDDPSASLPPTTWGRGVNDMDQIVGFYIDATGFHGFLESGGTYTTIEDPLATHGPDPNTGGTFANGINNAGQIVGGYRNASGEHGFLPSGGAMIVTALRAAGVG
jgi:probable HAF family extracellular repeat protein